MHSSRGPRSRYTHFLFVIPFPLTLFSPLCCLSSKPTVINPEPEEVAAIADAGQYSPSSSSASSIMPAPSVVSLKSTLKEVVKEVDKVNSILQPQVHYDPFAPNRIPFALRIKGSILGGMLPTLFFFGVWSSVVCYISMHHYSLAVEGLLITVTGS